MAKDPAFLLYYQDFLVGTMFMSNEQVGAYTRILCHQADRGAVAPDEIPKICSLEIWEKIKHKFLKNNQGCFYNKRLKDEVSKRKNYCESRKKSRSYGKQRTSHVRKTYVQRMEDEDEDEIKDKNILKKRLKYTTDFEQWYAEYPRKEAKGYAFKAWLKLTQPEMVLAINAIKAQATVLLEREPEYRPLPASWLNSRAWENETQEETVKKVYHPGVQW